MTSNVQWNNQFEGNYPANAENSNAWSRPLVNTPQTNPASWPQLGASGSEVEQAPGNQVQSQEEGGWTSTAVSSATTNSETSTTAWGRIPPDNGSKPKAPAASGWGAPSSGPAWGQQTTVDNGTAVWGKSASTSQPQSSWGGQGQSSQGTEVPASSSGWGGTNSTQAANGTESNSQPVAVSTSAATSSSQPVSWAKAASAGLPASNNGGNGSSTETDQEAAESTTPPAAPPSSTVETDPVQKLVNSHEGWGKKPIQQGTSWNITESAPQGPGFSRPPVQVSNGTEAWGRHGGAQMPSGPGWGDSTISKPNAGSGWGAGSNPSYQGAAPNRGWGAPTQQPTRPAFMSGNGPTPSNWGDQPQSSAVNNNRWNEISGQSSGSGWGNAPPVPMQPVNPGWGGSQSNEANSSNQWGANPQGPGSQTSGWNPNMVQQTPTVDQSTWNRPADPGVDNGTAAWGDPGTYTKVNMWDKRGKAGNNNEAAAGQMPPMNSQMKTTGWGAPPNQSANRPPSPKGWGDMSPTRSNPVDKGTSGWGQKPISNEKWDKGGNGTSNWNNMKQSGGGWNQGSDSQWGAPDNGPAWGQNDAAMKSSVDFGPRGMMPSPMNMSQQQMMLRNQTRPNAPPQPQFQNQFPQQIRHAVMNGIVPPQVLNPQLMTPQHMQHVMQLIAKTTEIQKVQAKLTTLMNQNKALPMPNVVRQQQIEQCMRAISQQQQQLEMLRGVIIQNMLQKAQPNTGNKMNNPMNAGGSMDMGRMRSGSAGQPMVSPLNNMNPMMQALPSPGLSSVTSPTGRDESRFSSNWKQPGNFGSMGDNLLHPNPSNMGMGMGPGGDSAFNGAGFRPQSDEPNVNEGRTGPEGAGQMPRDPMSNQVAAEASAALADIGPPEFTPGVPWKGFRHIDPEADPNITPGSVAIAKTMSINTVRDADQVLNRERAALPDTSTATVSSPINNNPTVPSNNSETPSQIWSTAGSDGNNWSGQNQQDIRGSWLVLTNFNQQVDPVYVQNLCAQHGTVASFRPHYPMEGTALVKYHTPDEALKAKNALNMNMVGSTMLVATVATDQDVSNFMTATAGGSWSSTSSSRFSASPSSYPNRDTTTLPSSGAPQPFWGNNPSTSVTPGTTWAGNASYNLAWSRSSGDEPGRVTSPMHGLLPENLLGGETM